MYVVLSITLLAILNQANADADSSVSGCKHPVPVEKFAASYYTALVVSHDPHIVDTLAVTGSQAGMFMYKVTKAALEKYRQCNAEDVAFIAGRALAHFKNLTLPYYFQQEAFTVGSILYDYGVLDCDNAVALSLEYLTYSKKEFQVLDPHSFDSYMHEIVFGGIELYVAHGLDLPTVLEPTADVFDKIFTEDKKQDQCVSG